MPFIGRGGSSPPSDTQSRAQTGEPFGLGPVVVPGSAPLRPPPTGRGCHTTRQLPPRRRAFPSEALHRGGVPGVLRPPADGDEFAASRATSIGHNRRPAEHCRLARSSVPSWAGTGRSHSRAAQRCLHGVTYGPVISSELTRTPGELPPPLTPPPDLLAPSRRITGRPGLLPSVAGHQSDRVLRSPCPAAAYHRRETHPSQA